MKKRDRLTPAEAFIYVGLGYLISIAVHRVLDWW